MRGQDEGHGKEAINGETVRCVYTLTVGVSHLSLDVDDSYTQYVITPFPHKHQTTHVFFHSQHAPFLPAVASHKTLHHLKALEAVPG